MPIVIDRVALNFTVVQRCDTSTEKLTAVSYGGSFIFIFIFLIFFLCLLFVSHFLFFVFYIIFFFTTTCVSGRVSSCNGCWP